MLKYRKTISVLLFAVIVFLSGGRVTADVGTLFGDNLPQPPEVDPVPGYYEKTYPVSLKSPQGYDVFYTFQEDAVLPDEGIRFTEPILLEEGIHNLRAVCVNGTLVSNELKATYKISMPKPQMPRCNLAPGKYKTVQRVKLQPGKDNTGDDNIQIYYTIDGSTPDLDSPLYQDDEVIQLPTGWATLQAVAVNQYGKISNALIVNYKIDADPKPKLSFSADDMIDSIRFGTTTRDEFLELYGQGEPAAAEYSEEYASDVLRYDYPWGYAVMIQVGKKTQTWVIAELCLTADNGFSLPRGTAIGNSEEDVVSRFRDMGQVESPSHNRGLYYNDKGSGKIRQIEEGYRVVRYLWAEDKHLLQLEYHLQNDQVFRIDMKYVP